MQTCPNCGATNPATAKFCTTCGQPLPGQATANSQANPAQSAAQPQVDPAVQAEVDRQRQVQAQIRAEQMAQIKQSSRSYWNYLVDSWKMPSLVTSAQFNRWFGLISMAAWALMGSIAVGNAAQAGVNRAASTTSSIFGLFGASSTADSINGTVQNNAMIVYFKFFLLLMVGMLAFGLIGFLFRKWAQKETISYLEYATDLMHRCNLNLILVLCALVFSLMGGFIQILSVFVITLGGSIFMIGFMQSIIIPKPRVGFDSVYLTVAAVVALEIILLILLATFGQSLASQFSSLF
ncbi:zinc ribbon domain-containing protein [Loigolactobacillus jiayinensis]|mgnify:CR=1 FL=1|uniref:DUF6574 domain-containing protein n=1 Tax=Loigolactobacillus jiayinensis TaxID=2486016 RepID=A0ABW1RDR9_9LACO|nr:zinc ribbon domain-containing protein [Loigolactobacillus jiayinensis]